MFNVRLAASRGSGTGWAAYDEQYRLRKARYPHTPWGDIDMELWLLHVRFLNLVHTNRGTTKWIKVRVICYYRTWRDGPLRNLNICVHIYTLKHGFKLQYNGPRLPVQSNNSRSISENPDLVREKIFKEIDLGRVAGPFWLPSDAYL
jgi:hypothetical protein